MEAALLTIVEAQKRTEAFLAEQMLGALRAVEYEVPSFDVEPTEIDLSAAVRARVDVRHVRGACEATYLVQAFGDELLMQLQLNVHRLVVVYRVPALEALDAATLARRRAAAYACRRAAPGSRSRTAERRVSCDGRDRRSRSRWRQP